MSFSAWVWVALGLVVLGVVLSVLKALAVINWPWVFVLTPFYPVVALIVLAIVMVVAMVSDGMNGNWH